MKVYIDLIMILNFFFDFFLLLSVSVLLRRNVDIRRIILGAFIGGLSMLVLFIPMNSVSLFIFKVIISIIMVLISFGYQNIKYTIKNLLYLYSASFILGGFLYFLNVQFSYIQSGLMFLNNGLSINVIFLIIFSPIIIYIYVRQGMWLKNNYSNYYKVEIIIKGELFKCNAFLDTGNQLVDPITKKPVILIDMKLDYPYFYVPYKTIDKIGVLKCMKADKVRINGKEKKKVLIGILDYKIKMDGINCLLNTRIMED